MKIYVVTRGDYSAYHICGLTTDKERAEKAKEFYSDDWYKAHVEVYDTDKFSSMENWKKFVVYFDKTGNATKVDEVDRDYDDFVDRLADWEQECGTYFACVFATDESSAIKIAAEQRAVYLAMQEELGL